MLGSIVKTGFLVFGHMRTNKKKTLLNKNKE